jgi:hypothetical protein
MSTFRPNWRNAKNSRAHLALLVTFAALGGKVLKSGPNLHLRRRQMHKTVFFFLGLVPNYG